MGMEGDAIHCIW